MKILRNNSWHSLWLLRLVILPWLDLPQRKRELKRLLTSIDYDVRGRSFVRSKGRGRVANSYP